MRQSKENRVEEFLRVRGLCGAPARLAGDASTRSFYRVRRGAGTAVLMTRDEPSREADRDFIEVRDLLASCGVPVPEIYEWDRGRGIVLMEDLGDLTLEECLRAAAPPERRRLYRLAVDAMLSVHVSGSCGVRDCPAFHRHFDETKLMEELDFFLRHTVEGLLGAAPSPAAREEIRAGFAELCRRLAAMPRVLNHRDYHSRNLMVVGDRLGVVDFQDARMGPCQYDLASLLKDSYTVLDRAFRAEMAAYYLDASRDRGIEWRDRDEFVERFDLAGIQRNLKACGTFGYMAVVRGNRRYLDALAPTFAYVREAAPRFPFLDRCIRALGRLVPQLRGEG
ncbi:MAG: phosphotransferase [Candidatus Aureabacteria bacterium]|nr:phosphotransferase [Candidatus Auribacterota bacterium]NLW94916.1 phosphotransferase [Chlamydiota bacterium]